MRQARPLGFWSLLTLGINGIVGVGIFFAPAQLAFLVPGPGSALAFVLTGLLLLPVAWCYGRLGSAYAEDGGPYVWAREAFGELPAFGVGFVTYVSAILSTATIVSALGEFLGPELGFASPGRQRLFALGAGLLFAGIAWLGLRVSAWVWSSLTVLKLLPLLLLAAYTLPLLRGLSSAHVVPPEGWVGSNLWRAALVAVFPLQGFEIVAVPSGEVRGSRRAVLAATLLSLGFAMLLYVVLQLGCVLAVPQLAHSAAPIVAAGTALGGASSRAIFSAGTNVSSVGIAFGMFAMTPRYLAALGTPSLLGAALGREQRGVPVTALGVTALAVVVLVAGSSLTKLFVLSALGVLAQFAVTALALFRLAWRGERGLGRVDLALAPLTLLAIVALASAAELVEIATLVGILVTGFVLLAARRALASRTAAR